LIVVAKNSNAHITQRYRVIPELVTESASTLAVEMAFTLAPETDLALPVDLGSPALTG
jgi:hypothetical protein